MNSIFAVISKQAKKKSFTGKERRCSVSFFFSTLNDKTMQKYCCHFNTGNVLLKQEILL